MTDIPTLTDGDVLDADLDWNPVANAINELNARGILDAAEVETAQTGITTTETDLTGLSISFTLTSTRKVVVEAYGLLESTIAADRYTMRIKQDGTTTVAQDFGPLPIANVVSATARPGTKILSLGAGSYTFKATLVRATGSGSLSLQVDSNGAAWIRATDVGAG